MRPSQQKNRMRGRGRKQPNPLSRNYESNGPDVKIRGNASHIAEKYATLARDAAASGDRVIAENYLQHAEHYNRIIAAATAAVNASRGDDQQAPGRGPQPDFSDRGDGRDERDENGREDGDDDLRQEDHTQAAGQPDEGERPKREARRRRSRRGEDGETAAAPNGGGEAPLNGEGGKSGSKKGISDDAAKLPGTLIGMGQDESAEIGVPQDD